MIVAFTVSCMREKYLRQAVDSWAGARGSGQCRALFCLEPPPRSFPVAAFEAYVKGAFPAGSDVRAADRRLRVLRNTYRAMSAALEQEDFGVVAEEDLQVADDVLEYLAWARDAYRGDGNVLAVCAHARAGSLKDPSAVVRASHFSPLVWGTWRDRWEQVIAPSWEAGEQCNPESWDMNLMQLVRRRGQECVFPVRSRVLHVGRDSTLTPWPLSEHFYRQFRSGVFAPHYDRQDYHEIPFPPRPGDLVV